MSVSRLLALYCLLFSGPLLAHAGHGPVATAGQVLFGADPLCALVLINGQSSFSCNGDGAFAFEAPLDERDLLTVQVFADGFAPVRRTLAPFEAMDVRIDMERVENGREFEVSATYSGSEREDWTRVSGTVGADGESVCALVLANGQKMFSCGASLGQFDLELPLDEDGNVTLMIFAAGFQPYRVVASGPVTAASLARAATETVKLAVDSEANGKRLTATELQGGIPGFNRGPAGTANMAGATDEVVALFEETQRTEGTCGGERIIEPTERTEPDEGVFPFTHVDTQIYNDYCTIVGGDPYIQNGTITQESTHFDDSYSEHITEQDLRIEHRGQLINHQVTQVCTVTVDRSASPPDLQRECNIAHATRVGTRRYWLTNAAISGNHASGWDVTGLLNGGSLRGLGVAAENFLPDCPDGNVSSGGIVIDNLGGSPVEVAFPNCSEYVVTYQGLAKIYPQ